MRGQGAHLQHHRRGAGGGTDLEIGLRDRHSGIVELEPHLAPSALLVLLGFIGFFVQPVSEHRLQLLLLSLPHGADPPTLSQGLAHFVVELINLGLARGKLLYSARFLPCVGFVGRREEVRALAECSGTLVEAVGVSLLRLEEEAVMT